MGVPTTRSIGCTVSLPDYDVAVLSFVGKLLLLLLLLESSDNRQIIAGFLVLVHVEVYQWLN